MPEPAPAITSSGPSVVSDGLPLGRVQVGEVVLRLRDGHAADASGAAAAVFPDVARRGIAEEALQAIDALARYVIRGGRHGYDRLQVLHRSRWPDTARLFERVGVAPGMRCIDLGCGGGEVYLRAGAPRRSDRTRSSESTWTR